MTLPKNKRGTTVKVDSKGRVVIPKEIRSALGLELGDKVLLHTDGRTIYLIPVEEDLIEVLGKHAEAEYRAGRTRNLRDYMQDHCVKE